MGCSINTAICDMVVLKMTSTDDPFRFSNSIMTTKERQDDLDVEKNYNPFFNNRILSQHVDCILHTNAMNCFYQNLTSKQQYDYYFNAIRKMKRKFGSWGKKDKSAEIELVMKYHGYSYRRAKEVVDLFSAEQFKHMKKDLDVGG